MFQNLTIQGLGRYEHFFDRLFIDDWQAARLAGADGTNMDIGLQFLPKTILATTKHLCFGLELNVDFHSNNWFVLHKIGVITNIRIG